MRADRLARALAAALIAAAVGAGGPAVAQPADDDVVESDDAGDDTGDTADTDDDAAVPSSAVALYFAELERAGLVDIATGSKETLVRELDAAEKLLRDGAAIDAAVALYTIVESPRYADFRDFVEYQNAEYYLGVALAEAGAYGAALDVFERVLRRGPSAPYWGPAHRRSVDVALETRDHAGTLTRLEAIKSADPIPPGASGERAYLRGRAAYDASQFDAAEAELVKIDKKSRLYSSSVYLRGVIKTRRGELRDAAAAMCEVAGTGDADTFTFVVDDRYFTIKDLARLGLGRLAHEQGDYDDAYYHYFQIPDDSQRLPEALFEASWSMYQKRELDTARDLVAEFLKEFPTSPLWPEADLLAGYVELADCKFDESQRWYDKVVADLQPIVDELDRTRKDPDRRRRLFDRALVRWRADRATGEVSAARPAGPIGDRVLALLRLDPEFVRLHDAVSGLRRAGGEAPGVVRAWAALARQARAAKVGAVSGEKTIEQEDAADASGLVQDLRRLHDQVARARAELRRGRADGTIDDAAAKAEEDRLADLDKRVIAATARAGMLASDADAAVTGKAAPTLAPMIRADLEAARRLDRAADALARTLAKAADRLAQRAIERLYRDTRRVLDKAKLGKIDAVIGQKRALDIQVQDLAQGRFPPELHGRLWEQGLIGDDEEYWPFEGEFWADEYEGWR